ncbi:MAG: ABC transporter ATP-binding protein [Euryarchaeota archaeon]|nr:ABC transporter ATP-binding protein [Euryarchaeota archaeon]MBT5254237.1 ABC transporter ATP-binding protein [Euryarchaeota archaeon]MDG1546545.1 ABC transporter ATP-binding protein [Candidatus Poseidoniaceae archaeon]
MRTVMEARALWKVYQTGDNIVQAVRGVDIKLQQGEMVAIMGRSGCGKTTLLNVLSGIDEPSSGEVLVSDKQLFGISDDERTEMRAQNFGFIFQSFNLLPVLSAVENVELPLLLIGMSSTEARDGALKALTSVGLEDRANHRPTELSGGQQQRVAIARAIVHSPSVILCDEPTGNLDSATSSEVMQLLRQINIENNSMLLLVTHDDKIAKQCDRILKMEDGIIISDISEEE